MDVSVIVPYHNEGELLQRAIDSIEGQTYQGELEIVVVDDASVVLPQIPARGRFPIRLVRSSRNIYAGAARNLGVAASTGRFICFLDADDVYLPEKVECHVDFLRRHPRALLVGGSYYVHQGTKSWHQVPEVILRKFPELSDREGIFPDRFRVEVCNHYGFNTGQTTIRREAFQVVGGFVESYRWGEEWDLMVRLAQHGPIGTMPQPVQHYIQRPGSITTTKNPAKFLSGARMYRNWRYQISGLSADSKRRLRRKEREWYLIAAQLCLEDSGKAGEALVASIRSLSCGLSLWGMRSTIRSGLHVVVSLPRR